ncbi:MAG: YhfC family intramembrane metalloprotease [Anaerolineales bacterium]|nr:YhfC family intramembrane metalloprotease [Anaerolineales bacterium]
MDPLFLLQGIGMITIAVISALYWKLRSRSAIAFVLLGTVTWIAAVVLKSIASIPMPSIIDTLRNSAPEFIAEPVLWLYIGLLTGIFECGLMLVFVLLVRRLRTANWNEAITYGLGFGGTEALVLGFYSFIVVLLTITIPEQIPPELIDLTDTSNTSLLAIPIPIIERTIVLLVHAVSSVLIIYAVRTKEWKWFWASFIYKTTLNAIAGFIHVTYGMENLTVRGAWLVKLVLLPFGILAIWGMLVLRNRWQIRESETLYVKRGKSAYQ